MGSELHYVCLVATRRLLLLIGVVFGMIWFVQYFELAYVDVLSSVFVTTTSPSRDPLSSPTASRNLTRSSTNSTRFNAANGFPSAVNASDGTDGDTRSVENELLVGSGRASSDDFGLENGKVLNDTLDDDAIDLGAGIPLMESLEMDRDSAIEAAARNYVGESEETSKASVGDERNEDRNTTSTRTADIQLSTYVNSSASRTTPSDDFGLEDSSGRASSDDFGLENGKVLNDTLDDDAIDLGAGIPLMESLEMDRDSAIEAAARNYVGESEETSKASVGDERNEDRNTTSTRTADIQLSTYVDSSASRTTPKPRKFKGRPAAGVPISEMNDLLRKSRVSYHSVKARWPSQADDELLNAKKLIESADSVEKSPRLDVDVYRNFSEFTRSYELMEQTLKIYIYSEGERPIFHQPELNGIYASEGWFMKQLEQSKRFVTKNPNKAHLFYLPFGSHTLRMTLYVPDSHRRSNLVRYLSSYLHNITTKHRFWNRTNGSDHFLVACHDWAPAVTGEIMNNCIRALCNTNVKKGFQFSKEVSLPVTYIRNATCPLKSLGGKPPSQRHILAFFAGSMHGYLRPILLHHWENEDPDMKIFGNLRKAKGQMTYSQYMKRSKYCISARGYHPFTPRVVEAIFYECVPVIIADNYIPPFFETLNWESFAVFILEKDIPNLKSILASIPQKRYIEMQRRVRQVQKHFLWHAKPLKFDVFHMILHSLWYTRVLQVGA